MATGWDAPRTIVTNVLPAEQENTVNENENKLYDFIQHFRLHNTYIYRDQLRQNLLGRQYILNVDLDHLVTFDEILAATLRNSPQDILPLFENAVKRSARQILSREEEVPDIQVTLNSSCNLTPVRDLNANYISKLIRIPGIVIGASTLTAKATQIHLTCTSCQHVKKMTVLAGFSGIQFPRTCESDNPGEKNCPLDPYILVHDKCSFIDQQTLKLQESPDRVPVGELPRHMLVSVDRMLTNKVVPGTRVVIHGIYSIFQNKQMKSSGSVAIRTPYIRAVGLEIDSDRHSGEAKSFSEEEEEEMIRLSQMPDLYERFSRSIAPSIYGNANIKKAICCLLFGGSKKILPDGVKLRGDINVLMLGDPGTAKSQLLKFVERVSPVAVYTSGKGSSAAGLTASVVRDSGSGEFYLEGGAMVLADGGVVCIDEFDKMREEDRVAIHEAMEQQTISIAKAGITTLLNSRTSVLAAANPLFGRYDDLRSPGENIDFATTILSRFDMIFIIRDDHNERRDITVAKHVMDVHMNTAVTEVGELSMETMRNYISYCKSKCAPRLSPEAGEKLSSHYVSIRSDVGRLEKEASERSTIPITVRQLEAIIRIAESLAKMTLSPHTTEENVDEAIRLFKHSTMDAVNSGNLEGKTRFELLGEVEKIERDICRRVPVGSRVSVRMLMEHLSGMGYSGMGIQKAIDILRRRDVLEFERQRLVLFRSRE